MTAFYVCGGVLALWAVLVSFLGITREGFPRTDGSARIVMALSVLLTLAAILSGRDRRRPARRSTKRATRPRPPSC